MSGPFYPVVAGGISYNPSTLPANPSVGQVFMINAGMYICTTAGTWTLLTTGDSGSGSVESVAMTVPSFLAVAGSPITVTGTLAVTLATQTANLVFAGPSSGSAATPTFRALATADIPETLAAPLMIGTNAPSAILGGFYAAIAIGGDSTFYDVFHDESTFSSTTTGGLASFDSDPQVNGATAYNHFNAFQDRAVYNGSGSIGSWTALNTQPVMTGSGIVTNMYGFHSTAPTVTSFTGSITNYYWLRLSSTPTVTGSKFGIYQDDSTAPNFLASTLQIENTLYAYQSNLGASNVSPGTAVTVSILDRTATTGATNVYIGSDNNGHVSATSTTLFLVAGTSGNRPFVIRNVSGTDVIAMFSSTTSIKTGFGLPLYFGDGALSSSTASSPVVMVDVGNNKITHRSTGIFAFSSSSTSAAVAADTGISRISAGVIGVGNGSAADVSGIIQASKFQLPAVGSTLLLKGGSNARTGTGTLSGGTLAVANTSITANSVILITSTGGGTNIGSLYVASQTASTGFTVSSSNVLDTSGFSYFIFETN